MTIREYLESLPNMVSKDGQSLRDGMMDSCEIWSNDACRGYCIEAMKEAGLPDEQIRQTVRVMRGLFDDMSIKTAEKTYLEF